MNFLPSEWLRCPLDQLALLRDEQQLRCDNGHSFDIARQGYVNLLRPADKRSRDPGDSKAMIAARQSFLDAGHYHPLATALAELLLPLLPAESVIVDAGCGEGYYLAQLHAQLSARPGADQRLPAMIGFDISKWAVQAATRRPIATWLVASNRHIPLAPNSADCILSLFGFPLFEAFRTLLKDRGALLLANAGPLHLIELREVIYPEIRHTPSTVAQQASAAGLDIGAMTKVQFKTAPLSQLEIAQLLSMTPHLFRASHAGKENAARLDQFPVTVDVELQLVHKVGGR
ncbi:MAG: methyltransferase domain-containing protein [Halioglobus sp.]